MKITKDIHDHEHDDMLNQIEIILESYNYDESTKEMYREMIRQTSVEHAYESLLRDLPDGFARGRFQNKDINRRLNQLGC